MTIQPSSAEFFEAKYEGTIDPWNFAGSPYELNRYRAILVALSHRRYLRAFEPGCSVGVLTEQLATICDEVLAIDFSPTAVLRAQKRCASLENVTIRCASLTEPLLDDGFELVVLSEIGYYFSPKDWRKITRKLISPMSAGATLLATHWLGVSSDHMMGGNQVHEILASNSLLRLEHAERHEAFRLDRWVRL